MNTLNDILSDTSAAGVAVALVALVVAAGGGAYVRRELDDWTGFRSLRQSAWDALLTVGFVTAILLFGQHFLPPAVIGIVAGLALVVAVGFALVPGAGAALTSRFSGNVVIGGLFVMLGLALAGRQLVAGATFEEWTRAGALVLVGALLLGDALRRMIRGD